MQDIIKACRSYRRFDESDRIDRKLLTAWVDAARLVASSGNAHRCPTPSSARARLRARVLVLRVAKAPPTWPAEPNGKRAPTSWCAATTSARWPTPSPPGTRASPRRPSCCRPSRPASATASSHRSKPG
ncbi:MAG: hypothetical protein ACLTMP_02185 [Eggerthella lenta]